MKVLLLTLSVVCISLSGTYAAEPITITVVYNNAPYNENCTTSWGLSIYIQGLADTILFDTGGDGSILLSNMETLGVDPKSIETVVLSHIHWDHIGGLAAVLESNSDVSVYLPSSFPDSAISNIGSVARSVVPVDTPREICTQVWTTGEMGTSMKEQSLVIVTEKGLIIITGCAHPGIVNIAEFAKDYWQNNIYLVLGGFHLMAYTEHQVKEIISRLKALGVNKVGPSHCTGGRPIELFKEAWQEDFINLGCGAKVSIRTNDK